jgi:hypothetical protein
MHLHICPQEIGMVLNILQYFSFYALYIKTEIINYIN